MKKLTFKQFVFRYLIDLIFCILGIAGTVHFFVTGYNHSAALGMFALYASGVIFRFRYLRHEYEKEIERLKNNK
jgi:hypothetical protein